MRVYEIAKEVGIPNKDLIAKIRALGLEVNNHMSSLDADDVARIKRSLEKEKHQVAAPAETKKLTSTGAVVRRRSADKPSDDGHAAPAPAKPVEAAPPAPAPVIRRRAVVEEAPAPVAAKPQVEAPVKHEPVVEAPRPAPVAVRPAPPPEPVVEAPRPVPAPPEPPRSRVIVAGPRVVSRSHEVQVEERRPSGGPPPSTQLPPRAPGTGSVRSTPQHADAGPRTVDDVAGMARSQF